MSEQPSKLSVTFLLNDEQRAQNDYDDGQSSTANDSQNGYMPSEYILNAQALTSNDTTSPEEGPQMTHSQRQADDVPTATWKQERRRYTCSRCSKNFKERGNLNKHINSVHLKEKPQVCREPGCGKRFSFRDGLIRHVLHVHRNERLHACTVCTKSFKQASHLAKHLRSIHKQS